MNIKISQRIIGNESPCFIIAEAGVNHNGDLNLAKKLVISAKEVGADCVKFQTFKADKLASVHAPKANYQLKTTDPKESQVDMLKKLELPFDAYSELIDLCKKIDIIFMSTPYNEEDVLLLESLGVDAFKLASISMVEPSFLEYVARRKKPIILSTGMATLGEVESGVNVISATGNNQLILLQCTTNYPTELQEVNLRAMNTIKNATNCLVGFSDHTQSNLSSIAAVAIGATVVEKHFTLDKSLPGPDQSSSYDPIEFRSLVCQIRDVEKLLGVKEKTPSLSEMKNIAGMRRSVVAKMDIPAGTKIDGAMLSLMRPATYTLAKDIDLLIGKIAKKDLKMGEFIKISDTL